MPTVDLIEPDPGTIIQVGNPVLLRWTASGATSFRLQYSLDNVAFTPIVTGLSPTTTTYSWVPSADLVPAGTSSVNLWLRIIARDEVAGTNAEDRHALPLATSVGGPSPEPTVRITSPDSGTFDVGGTILVQWTSSNATSHRVQYSLDDVSFTPIVTGLTAEARSYSWQVPPSVVPAGQSSVLVRLRVIARNDVQGTTAEDVSDGRLTIRAAAPPPVTLPTVTITSPDSGTFDVGGTILVQWTSSNATSHRVQYSLDDVSFTPIVTGLPAEARSFSWQVPPSVVPAGQSSVLVRLRVIARNDVKGTTAEDVSDGRLTIRAAAPPPVTQPTVTITSPDSGTFDVGGTILVQWTSSNATSHRVQYSLDDVSFTPIVTGLPAEARSYSWQVPPSVVPAGQSSVLVRLRVIARNDVLGTMADDISDGRLTLRAAAPPPVTQPTVRIDSPDSGTFDVGSSILVRWTSSNATSHRVQYSLDDLSYTAIVTALPADARSYSWQVPPSLVPVGQPSVAVRLRVIARNEPQGTAAEDTSNDRIIVRALVTPAGPRIDTVAPDRGPQAGGTLVVISGAGFAAAARVRVGGQEVTPTNIAPTSITVTTPPRAAPDRVSIRVINPDDQFAVADAAFQYEGAPELFEVFPPEGPAQPPSPGMLQRVTLRGRFLHADSEVLFGSQPATDVRMDGENLTCLVPPAVSPGPVDVRIKDRTNGLTARLDAAFTYLGPQQATRARIFRVVPFQILEDTPSRISVFGRNLAEAMRTGTLAFRTSSRATVRRTTPIEIKPSADGMFEEAVFEVRVIATPALGLGERLIVQALASRRPKDHLAQDGLFESSATTFTVLPRGVPVPLAFNARLTPGGPNLLLVAGAGLAGTTLELEHGLGDALAIGSQSADDRVVAAYVDVDAGASGPVRLVVRNGATVIDRYDLTLAAATTAPPAAGGGPIGSDPDPGLALQPVPRQRVVAPTSADARVHDLMFESPSPQSGAVSLVSPFIDTVGVEVEVANFVLSIPLFDEVRLLPLFDRGGLDIVDQPITARAGRVFAVRALALVLVLRVELTIEVSVALFIGVRNPLVDFASTERFFELPGVSLPDVFGSVVLGFRIDVSAAIDVRAFVALVSPDGNLRALASLGLDLRIADGRIELDASLYARVRVGPSAIQPLPIRPSLADQIALLPNPADPAGRFSDPTGLGTFALYFPRAPRRYCLDWSFDFELILGFRNGGELPPLQAPSAPVVCLSVGLPARARKLRIEPPSLELAAPDPGAPGERRNVTAFEQEVDLQGRPVGTERELAADDVTFEPTLPTAVFVVAKETTPTGKQWVVTSKAAGTAELTAYVATTGGAGTALFAASLPGTLGFLVGGFASGQPPLVSAAFASVRAVGDAAVELLPVRGRIIIGDELGAQTTPPTAAIGPTALTVHFSTMDDAARGRVPIREAAAPDVEVDFVDLRAAGTFAFDLRIPAQRVGGKLQVSGFLVVKATWSHRTGTGGSNVAAAAERVAILPLVLQQDATPLHRAIVMAPDVGTPYLWTSVEAKDATSGAALMVGDGTFSVRIRNSSESGLHYRAGFTIDANGRARSLGEATETVFGVPVAPAGASTKGVCLVSARGIRPPLRLMPYFDRSEYAVFTTDQRNAQTTAPIDPRTVPRVTLTTRVRAGFASGRVLVVDPGHGINYEGSAKRLYEWYVAYQVCEQLAKLWRGLGGICEPVPTAGFKVGTSAGSRLDIGVNVEPLNGVNDDAGTRQVLLTISRDPTFRRFRWEALRPLSLVQFCAGLGLVEDAERVAFITAYQSFFETLERRTTTTDGFVGVVGSSRYDSSTDAFKLTVAKGASTREIMHPLLRGRTMVNGATVPGDFVLLRRPEVASLADVAVANSFTKETGSPFNQILGSPPAFRTPRTDVAATCRTALIDGVNQGRSLDFAPRRRFINAVNPDFAVTVHLNAATSDGVDTLVRPRASPTSDMVRVAKRIAKYVDPLGNGRHGDGIDRGGSAGLANMPPLAVNLDTERYAYVELDYMDTPEPGARGGVRYGYMESAAFVENAAQQLLAAIVEILSPVGRQSVDGIVLDG